MLQNSTLKFSIPRAPLTREMIEKLDQPLAVARKLGVLCVQCGRPFEVSNLSGPVPKYCSPRCKTRAYRARKHRKELEEVLS